MLSKILTRTLSLLIITAFLIPTGTEAALTRSLYQGFSGSDVTELQTFLYNQGYLTVTPTGYFGPLTRQALVNYQTKIGLEPVGHVGPLTRASINAFNTQASADSVTTTPPPTITQTTDNRSKPTLRMTAVNKTITPGSTATFSWTSTNATSCTASRGWSGIKAVSGTVTTEALFSSRTYRLTCKGPGGSVSKSLTIKIDEDELTPAPPSTPTIPTITLTATPSSIASGGSSTLVWNVTDALSCTASDAWSGTKAVQGTLATGALTTSKTYSLTCEGTGGSATKSVTVTVSVSAPSPVPPPVSPTPSVSSAVYPGCEAPATSFSRTIYVDPVNGTLTGDGTVAKPFITLQDAFDRKLILPGDHIVLLPGNHGPLTIDARYKHVYIAGGTKWIWIDPQPGATMTNVTYRDASRLLISGLDVVSGSATVGTIVSFIGGSNVVVTKSSFSKEKDSTNWNAATWIAAPNALNFRNTKCVSITNNTFKNVRHAIGIGTDAFPLSDLGAKALVEGNIISGFSGDGLRPNASDIIVRNNRILESMAGAADGDANHDDGIQFFPQSNDMVFKNILIENNWIQEAANIKRPMIGYLQGIGHFDGPIDGITIRNNVLIISAYWGIAGAGMKNAVIENNTVINSGASTNKVRIGMNNAKFDENYRSPDNITLRNNITTMLLINASSTNITQTNNYLTSDFAGIFTKYDPVNGVYDLRPKVGGPIDGKGVGAKGLSSGLTGGVAGLSIVSNLSRMLNEGMKGDDVGTLQQLLKQLGFYTYPEITGYYGPATVAAVKAFQHDRGLEETGGVGPKTLEQVNNLLPI